VIGIRRQIRAFTLVELLIVVSAVAGTLFVLGKLLVDGIYLQRTAAEHANRVAVTQALTRRLRADALGATARAWGEDASGLSLKLVTYADGAPHQAHWAFERERAVRRVDGCEAGLFFAERLQFSAHITQRARSDVLVLDLIVTPPARAWSRSPRTHSEYVLIPRESGAPVEGERLGQP